MESIGDPPNRTKRFFYKLCRLVYMMGAPDFWYEDLKMPPVVYKLHDTVRKVVDVLVCTLIMSGWGAILTQHNLSKKQTSDLTLFCFVQPTLYGFILTLEHYKANVRFVFFNLAGTLKDSYNDVDIEAQMIRKIKIYTSAFAFTMSSVLIFYGVDGLFQVIFKGGTFTTMVTAWPDVHDTSRAAGVGRVVIYVVWWCYLIRFCVAYIVVIPVIICLSHQFKQLQSYFLNIHHIFEDRFLSQEEKEKKYEDEFKIGIKLHSATLSCTKHCETIGKFVYGGAIFLNILALALVMKQILNNTESSVSSTLPNVASAVGLLTSTGCLMWTAGDVTAEASQIAYAMYCSGWYNCRDTTAVRIRPILVISIARSQMPVELRCLGVVTLSYQSYVSIVKTSYSVFSLFYKRT